VSRLASVSGGHFMVRREGHSQSGAAPTATINTLDWPGHPLSVTLPGGPTTEAWAIGTASVNVGGNAPERLDPTTAKLTAVDGGAVGVAVGPNGQPWIFNQQGTIFRRTKGASGYADGAWQVLPGRVTDLAVGGDGSVWAIGVLQSNIGGNYIYHYNPQASSGWDQIDGGAVAIAVDAYGVPWVLNKQGAVLRRAPGKTGYLDGTWNLVAPNSTATNIGVGGPLS
jgi:hypothetical protein